MTSSNACILACAVLGVGVSAFGTTVYDGPAGSASADSESILAFDYDSLSPAAVQTSDTPAPPKESETSDVDLFNSAASRREFDVGSLGVVVDSTLASAFSSVSAGLSSFPVFTSDSSYWILVPESRATNVRRIDSGSGALANVLTYGPAVLLLGTAGFLAFCFVYFRHTTA